MEFRDELERGIRRWEAWATGNFVDRKGNARPMGGGAMLGNGIEEVEVAERENLGSESGRHDERKARSREGLVWGNIGVWLAVHGGRVAVARESWRRNGEIQLGESERGWRHGHRRGGRRMQKRGVGMARRAGGMHDGARVVRDLCRSMRDAATERELGKWLGKREMVGIFWSESSGRKRGHKGWTGNREGEVGESEGRSELEGEEELEEDVQIWGSEGDGSGSARAAAAMIVSLWPRQGVAVVAAVITCIYCPNSYPN